MEVHHHGHVHETKKWKEYVFQFIMLFLAVLCGSLAEFELEHKIESDREKVYVRSFIEDLQKDTSNLTSVISDFENKNLQLDTALTMYKGISRGYNNTFHRNLFTVKGYPDFIYADRTMQQLKNSGNMRLIRNKSVSDAILNYDTNVRDLIMNDVDALNIQFYGIRQLWRELMDDEDLENDLKSKSIAEIEKEGKNYLLKNDKASLGEFNNSIRDIKSVYTLVKTKEIALKEEATNLIILMKKVYHIE